MAMETIEAVTWGGEVITTCSSTILTISEADFRQITLDENTLYLIKDDLIKPTQTNCKNCGAPLKIGNDYCEYCGTIC